jgi:putative hydrolase of the HAD superfamily
MLCKTFLMPSTNLFAEPGFRNPIKVISFDLDDTLWDCDPVIAATERVLHGALKEKASRIAEALSPPEIAAHRLEFAKQNPQYSGDVTAMRRESLRQLVIEHGYPGAIAEELFDIFYVARSQVTLYEDALAVLERLSGSYGLSALTNGNADLALIGIDGMFTDIQRASQQTPAKPDRTMFDRTARVHGIATSEILHVGDSPITDIAGARNAGAHSVWFNQHNHSWPDEEPAADFEISSLPELLVLLDLH